MAKNVTVIANAHFFTGWLLRLELSFHQSRRMDGSKGSAVGRLYWDVRLSVVLVSGSRVGGYSTSLIGPAIACSRVSSSAVQRPASFSTTAASSCTPSRPAAAGAARTARAGAGSPMSFASCARAVEGRVVEHVARPDQPAVGELEAEGDDPRRAVEAAGCASSTRHRHQRRVVRAAHAAGDGVRQSRTARAPRRPPGSPPGSARSSSGRPCRRSARPSATAAVSSHGRDLAGLAVAHPLDHVARGRADEHQQVVHVLRGSRT